MGLGAPVLAQATKWLPRVGYLAAVSATADAPRLESFRRGLRELGYVEGQNIVIENRHENVDLARLPELAEELVRLEVDVLVAVTANAAPAASRASSTIPIVFMGVTDPVAAGLVDSLAHPGRDSTGITNMAATLAGKRLQLLAQALPKLKRVALLWDPLVPGSIAQWQQSQQPAGALRMQLYSMRASLADDYVAAFKQAVAARHSSVWVTLNPLANSNQKLIAELAIDHRLPTVCGRADYAANGCLLAYGPGYSREGRDGARYLDRILTGARPAEVPVEQPTTFELVINLKTARRIGMVIPQSLLNRADMVIE